MNIKHNFDWEKLIKKQKESGLNAINFCKQHNLPYQTFLTHRRNTETKVLSLGKRQIEYIFNPPLENEIIISEGGFSK